MVEIWRSASTRLKKEKFDKYNKICNDEGLTTYADLKNYIEGKINVGKLGKNGNVNRQEAEGNDPRLGSSDKWFFEKW